MESRGAWTDKRLDDRFDHVDLELTELRTDIRELRAHMDGQFTEVRGEVDSLRATMIRFGASFNVALVGVIVAVLLRGA